MNGVTVHDSNKTKVIQIKNTCKKHDADHAVHKNNTGGQKTENEELTSFDEKGRKSAEKNETKVNEGESEH